MSKENSALSINWNDLESFGVMSYHERETAGERRAKRKSIISLSPQPTTNTTPTPELLAQPLQLLTPAMGQRFSKEATLLAPSMEGNLEEVKHLVGKQIAASKRNDADALKAFTNLIDGAGNCAMHGAVFSGHLDIGMCFILFDIIMGWYWSNRYNN